MCGAIIILAQANSSNTDDALAKADQKTRDGVAAAIKAAQERSKNLWNEAQTVVPVRPSCAALAPFVSRATSTLSRTFSQACLALARRAQNPSLNSTLAERMNAWSASPGVRGSLPSQATVTLFCVPQ